MISASTVLDCLMDLYFSKITTYLMIPASTLLDCLMDLYFSKITCLVQQ